MTGLLLAEKVCLDILLPPFVPILDALVATYGLLPCVSVSGILLFAVSFWGMGTIMALPALLGALRWKIQPNRSCDIQALMKAMPLIFFNFCWGAVFAPIVFYALLPAHSFDLRATPSMRVLLRDVFVWMTVEEIMFFHCHRWMHENKRMYAAFHKLHHTWTAPVSFVAIYCHPFEHLVCNLMPLMMGPILCGSHVVAIGVLVVLGLLHTLAVHSGYWICDDNGMHDEHHAKFTVNYGVLGVMDAWYGTYQLPAGASGAEAAAADVRPKAS